MDTSAQGRAFVRLNGGERLMSKEIVQSVQARLQELGYYGGKIDVILE